MPELLAPRTTTPPLAIEDLGYLYQEATEPSLGGISLEVGRGEFVVLAGRSASGKSSLLRAACGLIPHFHGGELSGTVHVGGLDTSEHGPGDLARLVGYVAQDPETQVVSTTVAAEIELPLELRGDGRHESQSGRGGGAGPRHPPSAETFRRDPLRRRTPDEWPSPQHSSPAHP